MIDLLVAHGADVNARSKDGSKPLDIVGAARREDLADILRRHGAKI
jgi:ankyrin repeat protein